MSWFTSSSLFAIMVAVLLNNYFQTNQEEFGRSIRSPTPQDLILTIKNEDEHKCRGGQSIFAYGDVTFLSLNLTRNGAKPNANNWGWEITDDLQKSIYVRDLVVNAVNNKYGPQDVVGFVKITNGDGVVSIDVVADLGEKILCDISIYVGCDHVRTLAPSQYTCMKRGKNEILDPRQCQFPGPHSKLHFEANSICGETPAFHIVVHAVYCSRECNKVCVYGPVPTFEIATVTENVTWTVTPPARTSIITNDQYITQTMGNTITQVSTTTAYELVEPSVITTTSTYTSIVSATTTVNSTSCVPVQTPQCIDFGLASPFNAFISGNYQGSSDVQGRLAVAGNASLTAGFSVGDQLPGTTDCNQATFVVGGMIQQWQTGRNYFGSIVVGMNSSIGSSVTDPGCIVKVDPLFFNFTRAQTDVTTENFNLCQLAQSNAQLSVDDGGSVTIVLQNVNATIQVININNGNYFNGVVNFINPVQGYTNGTVIVFNINGTAAGIADINMEALADIPVIFNFCNAQTLTINGVAVRGWIIAPYATVSGATGVVWGSVFVRSLSGSLQINIGVNAICSYDSPEREIYVSSNVISADTSGAESILNGSFSIFYTVWMYIFALFYY